MSSNLKVNSIIPSSGGDVGLGTVGGTITARAPIVGIATFSGDLSVAGVSTFSGVVKIPTVAGTNTNAALGVLFQTAAGVIDGGSGLTYNPGGNVLSVNGNHISLNTFRGDGDLGTLTCDNHSSTTFVKVSSKLDLGIKDNTAGAFNIKEGSNEYITIDTTDSSELIKFTTAGTERFRIGAAGQIGLSGATYGSSGQVLTSGGASATPTWTTISSGVDNVTSDAYGIIVQTTTTSNDSTVLIKGNEGKDARVLLQADEGDDNADLWRINVAASDGTLAIQNYAGGAWENNILLYGNGAAKFYKDNGLMCETSNDGLKFPAGKGIDFSSTSDSSGTMASELFDDYEEGSFTGTWTGYTTAASTTATSTNYYTKIGQQVTCYINLSNATIAGGGGAIKMEGLPYATSSDSHGGQTSTIPLMYKVDFNTNQNYHHVFYNWQSVSFIIGYYGVSGSAWQPWSVSDFHGGNRYCQFIFTYRAAT